MARTCPRDMKSKVKTIRPAYWMGCGDAIQHPIQSWVMTDVLGYGDAAAPGSMLWDHAQCISRMPWCKQRAMRGIHWAHLMKLLESGTSMQTASLASRTWWRASVVSSSRMRRDTKGATAVFSLPAWPNELPLNRAWGPASVALLPADDSACSTDRQSSGHGTCCSACRILNTRSALGLMACLDHRRMPSQCM